MIDSVIMAYINDVFEDGFHSVDFVGIFVWPVKSESKGLIWLLLFFVADVSDVFGWRGKSVPVLVEVEADVLLRFILEFLSQLANFTSSIEIIEEVRVIFFHQRVKTASKAKYLVYRLLLKAIHKLIVDVQHL